jgi:hypothetical protein
MSIASIINAHIHAGIWSGELTGVAAPQITVTHQATKLDGVSCTHDAARDVWQISVPIPADLINEGLQTFAVNNGTDAIAHFSLMAGEALAGDLRAEINLLRSELDMLKSAFRAHCAAGEPYE